MAAVKLLELSYALFGAIEEVLNEEALYSRARAEEFKHTCDSAFAFNNQIIVCECKTLMALHHVIVVEQVVQIACHFLLIEEGLCRLIKAAACTFKNGHKSISTERLIQYS